MQYILCPPSVQRRWTRQVLGLTGLDYGERLRLLNLFSIRGRFLRSDLIKYWKILCCKSEGCDLSGMFDRVTVASTRGHRHKLRMPICATDLRKKFFNVRRIMVWNSLPSAVVESSTVSAFKSSLAEFLGGALYEF